MSDTQSLLEEALKIGQVCSVCDRISQGEMISVDTLAPNVRRILESNAANVEAFCARCYELFQRAQRQIDSHATVFEQHAFVLPTPLRMDADERFTGRGVTIAFLDSGFYAHVDLTTPRNRIVAYRSLVNGDGGLESLFRPDVASWHGMMTSVVASGNGSISNG